MHGCNCPIRVFQISSSGTHFASLVLVTLITGEISGQCSAIGPPQLLPTAVHVARRQVSRVVGAGPSAAQYVV